MEDKMIPMYPNGVPHREQPVAQAKKNLNRDITIIRDELADLMQGSSDGGSYGDYLKSPFTIDRSGVLQEALDIVTQGGEAGTNFASEEEFHQLVYVYEETKGEHETVVGMQADRDGEIVVVDELESAQKSHGSVSYHAEELNNTQATSHNHPTESKKNNEIVLQGFSAQDIESNKKTKEQITQTQGAEAAANYTHFLSKAFEVANEDGKIETYQTVIGSGLDNLDNTQRQTFTIGDKTYNHAVKCPDGQIRDVMDLPTHVAAEILRNRLLAIDDNGSDLKLAS